MRTLRWIVVLSLLNMVPLLPILGQDDPAPSSTETPSAALSLVVVGDSIAYNSPQDCPGCTGFVDRYASAFTEATGYPVEVNNLSEHNSLQIDGLLEELETDTERLDALANADIIIVNIAHNDVAWGRNDDPCDGTNGDIPDWSMYTVTCATAAAEIFRPKFEDVFSQVVALRAGKPTIFLTINHYNDWIGTQTIYGTDVPPEAAPATKAILDAWNEMVCEAAVANGFLCADIYHAFNRSDGLTPSGDLVGADFTHPSDKGNELISQVLTDLGYAPLFPDADDEATPDMRPDGTDATESAEATATPSS